jgi:signal transduction histidine kinase
LDSLIARLLLISLIAITIVHALSLWTYEHALERELTLANEARLAERLVSIKRSVMLVPRAQREALAHDLSGGPIEAHWNESRGAAAGGPGAETWRSLARTIEAYASDLGPGDVIIGTAADPHSALLSLRLPDDSWLNVNLFTASRSASSSHGALLSTSLMAGGVVLLSLLMARWLTAPLRRIAEAVTALAPDDVRSNLPVVGPKEVRNLATAFNDVRRRLAELVQRRTRALAAVSHDLRTPLTRLKLRLGEVESDDLQRAMAADIDEMEQMIGATLSYLKGGETDEPARAIDLVALLETIIDGARDGGRVAVLEAPGQVVVQGRHVGLKRAFQNLVGNALRFGSEVRATVRIEGSDVVVAIDDNGPGIPEDKLEVVTEPFVRLEDSRNAETGGVGLGLTIAKSLLSADGGSLALANRVGGGLSAVVRLQRVAS